MKNERRVATRFIKRVPVQIMLAVKNSAQLHTAETLNISTSGAYFATNLKLQKGTKLELCLKIPPEIKSLPPLECKFTGRIAHVEPLGKNGMSGVGVHFLCYSIN